MPARPSSGWCSTGRSSPRPAPRRRRDSSRRAPTTLATTGRTSTAGARGRVAGARADRRHHRRARLGAAATGAPPHAGRAVLAEVHRARGIRPRRRAPLLRRVRRSAPGPLLEGLERAELQLRTSPRSTVDGRLVSPGLVPRDGERGRRLGARRPPDNLVVAGGLAPYGTTTATLDGDLAAPLHADAALPVATAEAEARPAASGRAFDVWSHHPYTSGGPTHEAGRRTTSRSATSPRWRRCSRGGARRARSGRRAASEFWVTEFSWDTTPPDPKGVPMELHARWVAEALYRMWRTGVSARDVVPRPRRAVRRRARPSPASSSAATSGPASDTPKPSHAGVPLPVRRVPTDASARCATGAARRRARRPPSIVERSAGDGWRRVARVRCGIDRDLHRHASSRPQPDRLGPGAHRSRRRGVGAVLPPRAARPGRVPVRLVLT